jgi:hypothetical protein
MNAIDHKRCEVELCADCAAGRYDAAISSSASLHRIPTTQAKYVEYVRADIKGAVAESTKLAHAALGVLCRDDARAAGAVGRDALP